MRSFLRDVLILGLILLITAGALWYVRACEFVNYDDPDYVGERSPVGAGLTADNVRWAFTTTHAANWHPLTWLSLELDAEIYTRLLGGASAGGYHLTNLLLHLATTAVLYLALRRLTGSVWPCALVAGLFGVHPLHVESVAWISERKDVLSALFWMLTLWCYAGYVQRGGWWRYALVLVVFTLGLMAKPMLVTLPCVLLLLDYWPLNSFSRDALAERGATRSANASRLNGGIFRPLLEKVPLFALAGVSCVVTAYAQHAGGAVQTFQRFPFGVRLANALVTYVQYIRKTFWPHDLALFYPHPGESLAIWQIGGAALVLIAVTALCVWQARRRPYLIVGWLWYLGTLVPVIGLVQVGAQAMADRYTYIPHIGLFIMFAWGLADLVAWRPVLRLAVGFATVVMLGACTVATARQTFVWHDGVSLWEHTLSVTSDNYLAHYLYGLALVEQKRPKEATEQFEKAVALRPNDPTYHLNVGMFLEQQWGRTDDALEHFTRAVRLAPDSVLANYNRGKLLEKLGRFDEAAHHFRVVLDSGDPTALADAYRHLGQVLVKQGKASEAVPFLRRAVDLRQDDPARRFSLADALEEAGETGKAAELFAATRRADPDGPAKARKTAWKLATEKSTGARDPWEAVRLARLASRAVGGRDPEYLDTLAAAYAAVGDFTRAEQTARTALALADGNRELARTIAERLQRYEKKQALVLE